VIGSFLFPLIFIVGVGQQPDTNAADSGSSGSTDQHLTNSGKEFKDPFAEPETPANPAKKPAITSPTESATPTTEQPPAEEQNPTENPVSPAPSAQPSQVTPSVNENSKAPSVTNKSDQFQFPKSGNVRGPVSQEFQAEENFSKGTPVGTWNFELDGGAGFNLNRRPNQLDFEAQGGYRLFDKIELNAILYWRFITERMLGLLVEPSWTYQMTGWQKTRMDLRLGLGTGWVLLGRHGQDFQLGYFPVRIGASVLFYALKSFSIVLSANTEMYLFQIDSDHHFTNLAASSKGIPTQIMTTAGLRWEF